MIFMDKRPYLYYAVARGYVVGLFDSWYSCMDSVRRYQGRALYRGVYDRMDAEIWLDGELEKAAHE